MKTNEKENLGDIDPEILALEAKIAKVKTAQRAFAEFTQEKVDKIFAAAALAANNARIPLAKMAVEETQMGIVEDKVIKNHFASEFIYNKYKDLPTCGVLERDEAGGIEKIAEPVGIIAGVVPTTNPTSTAIFKALMALKTRNGIIFSPHPRAKKSTVAAAKVVLDAAVAAGAPAGIIDAIEEPTVLLSNYLMSHKDIDVILATGGPGMVHAAYSSGTPAIGVGAGNTPAIIDETADLQMAVSSILQSKTFDNGMICASEQSVVVVDKVYDTIKTEFLKRGAYILTPAECEKVGNCVIQNGKLNAAIVGQSAYKIAKLAGVEVAPETKVLIGEADIVGKDYPMSYEKLSPVLGMFKVANFAEALDKAEALVEFGGMGHTSVLYTDPSNADRINEFGHRMHTGRTLINMPSSQGAIGDIFNFRLAPSLTLGCGSWGGNSVSQNVGPQHLINIKTIAKRRENMLWFRVPEKIYFKYGCLPEAMKDLAGHKKAFVVTDKFLYSSGALVPILNNLELLGIKYDIFGDVEPDPTLQSAQEGVERMNSLQPDLIIAFGGGSAMDAAKIMWLLYEHPEIDFHDIAMRFMDIRKRVFTIPKLGEKALMVAIPTTSGTGSEVTPFAVITDGTTGNKYPLADYALTPNMAIVDTQFVMSMPKKLTAYSGFDAVSHAFEALASVMASDYADGLAKEALRMLFKYLPRAYNDGANDEIAREKVHHASTMAGMAFANAFLGICHSMAHKMGGEFHVPHGLANAILLNEVIKFNASDRPTKQGTFSQYKYPNMKERYSEIAEMLGFGGKTQDESIKNLLEGLNELRRKLDIPMTFQDAGVSEVKFLKNIDMVSEKAFDDQCTGGNPRYPLISEIKTILTKCYYGK